MSQLNAYLFFNGNCADAMRFYERALGGKIEMMMSAGESPMAKQMASSGAKLIMHARLSTPSGVLMASDWMSDQPYEGMRGCSLSLTYPTPDDCKRVYDTLADGGKTRMPLQKTFWSDAFGMLVDRFGTHWMINCESDDK